MTDYVDVLREFNTPAMSKVAPSTYDQYERMAMEIAELRDRLADMRLAFEGSQILLGDVTRERDRLVRAIDEEMIKCGELGTFSLRDDPRQALHLLAVWNQDMGAYFAMREQNEMTQLAFETINEKAKLRYPDEPSEEYLKIVEEGLKMIGEHNAKYFRKDDPGDS